MKVLFRIKYLVIHKKCKLFIHISHISLSLDDVRDIAKQKHICPYYYARENLAVADVVVFNYQVSFILSHSI